MEGLVRVQVDRAERFGIEAQGMVQAPARLPVTARIVNLSRTGCLVRGPRLEPGTRVSIAIPGIGPRAAMVVRAEADGVGCAFVLALTRAALDAALATRDAGEADAAAAVRRFRHEAPAAANEPGPPPSLWRRMRGAPAGRRSAA